MDTMPSFTNSDLECFIEDFDLKSGTNFHSELHDDETMFVGERDPLQPILDPFAAVLPQEVSPSLSPTCTIPCRDDFPGPLNFEILLDSHTANRKSWVYSHLLKKVFIDINKCLLVQFKVQEYSSGLRVRALPVYSMDDFVSTPVQRCALHELNDDRLREAHRGEPSICFCKDYNWVRHVVQSSHQKAQYEYDTASDRHSVLVPLDAPQAGSDIATVGYLFTCKTSCTRGMNRKPIEVIFTLETELCQVIGRQILPVKICSCPKRDKEKEEEDSSANKASNLGKRRMSAADRQELAKKIKSENNPLVDNEQENNKSAVNHNQEQMAKQLHELKKELSSQGEQLRELKKEMGEQLSELGSQLKVLDAKFDCIYQLLNQLPNNVHV